jgi:hypothetical protein
MVEKAIASVVAGESSSSTDPLSARESAAPSPQDDTSLVDVIPGVAISRSAIVQHQEELVVLQEESRRISSEIIAESSASATEARLLRESR